MLRKFNLLQRTDLIFALVLPLYIALILITIKSAEDVKDSRRWEAQGFSALRNLERLLSYSIDIETASRGYAITGKDEFLEPYEQGVIAIDDILDSLKDLVQNHEQFVRLDSIDLLLEAKLAISERIIDLREERGTEYALNYIASGDGNRIMDSIRHVISRAVKDEVSLLSQRSDNTNAKRTLRGIYFLILIVLTLFIVVAAYLVTRKNIANLLAVKRTQENLIDELSFQNKQLDDFAHITSHNVRGPAANFYALLSMVGENSSVDEYQLIFSKLKNVSANLNETLNELMDILHVRGNRDVEKVDNKFIDIFRRERENLQGEILKSDAEIIFDFDDAPSVTYPKVYIDSIAHNLLSNALKYRSPERKPIIRVWTENKDNGILLHVSDNGLGIDLKRFGHALFGLRKTFHDHPEARGVGLFMTKAQVETFGGNIFVQSEPGKGTTFSIRF